MARNAHDGGPHAAGSVIRRVLHRLGVDSVDPLTGLHRAEQLARQAPRMLNEAGGESHSALLLLDLDHFKQINDAVGHDVGDHVLAEVGHRIQDCLLPDDLAVRLGGDEFVVLTTPTADTTWIAGLAQRLIEAISAPIHIEDLDLSVSVSIGVAFTSVDGTSLPQLRRAADQAMYAAKQSGPGRWRISTGAGDDTERSSQLLTALANDPDANQITVHYQPQVEAKGGHIVGFEALARWEHPELGMVLPHEFIPLAERSGLMPAINRAVLDRALGDLHRLQSVAAGARLSLNITPRHLMSRGLVAGLQERLEEFCVDPADITLEITEAITRGSPEQWEVLSDLHDLGVSVSIRGFGATQSTLSALWTSEAVTEVKMDPSFVRAAVEDPSHAKRLRAATGAAKGLGLRVVAQGVEERKAAQAGGDLGCDVLQGFWIAEAANLRDTLVWAHSWPAHSHERRGQPGPPHEALGHPQVGG